MTGQDTRFECNVCGWIYDASVSDPERGIEPGTRWERLPKDWICPVCRAGKSAFHPIEAVDTMVQTFAVPLPIVIVGSGLAGYSLARELRKRSAKAPIIIVSADGGEVYSKPMLSAALAKGAQADDMVQKQAAAVAAELGISIKTRTRVIAIDRADHTIKLSDGSCLSYDRLVLALGADPRVFPAPGSESVGIATVNDLDDYRVWRRRIGQGGRILLIGAGLIGCEFANDLASAGFGVTVIDPAAWPLARLLPKDVGTMLTGALEAVGVTFHLGRTVARYDTGGPGLSAILDNGKSVSFDYALSAVGLAPRIRLAADAGLAVRAGILVDQMLCTTDPAIYALGDCAETKAGPLPFIAPLLAEARALAATLSGEPTPLSLPALPVVVKTPALPLVVCPPRPGADGAWSVSNVDGGAAAIFRTSDGEELGFALAGPATRLQREWAKKMPDLLAAEKVELPNVVEPETWICDTCGWVYDSRVGDPENGIKPGTAWAALADDWTCPICGVDKSSFTKSK